MWRLHPTESGTGPISLHAGKEYVVGRKNCDILLPNDQSISRVHAHITVTEQAVTLKDSSKYGTFINDKRLETGSIKTVHIGDKLTFGVFQSKFRLELDSMVVCSSCVDNEGKATLSGEVQAVGGRVVNTWSQECTHLVMAVVKVTIKTICALLCCRPIVKPEFFTELSRAVQQRENLPTTESFCPDIGEPSLRKDKVDLRPHHERKTLFVGKTFVFLNTKQMKRLSQAISFGGGRSQLLEDGSLPLSLLQSNKTCVVNVTTGSSQPLITPATKKWVESISLILHRNGLRLITESEIGLATIYVSDQTYCNPCSSLDSESEKLRPAISEATLSQNAAVNETVLHGTSLNITAYVVNTEPSQSIRGKDVSGATAVGETPEKRPAYPLAPATSERPPGAAELPSACPEPVSSFGGASKKKAKSEAWKSNESPKLTGSLNNSATVKKSPQKQASLTSYFKTSNKKRPHEGSSDSELSEAKFSKQDEGSKETKNLNIVSSMQNSSAIRLGLQAAQNQHDTNPRCGFSGSLDLGSGFHITTESRLFGSQQNPIQSLDSSSKKRKEREQDPVAPSDLDVSLEELESIMSEDMDEPVQPTANKKQCLDQGERSTAFIDHTATFRKQQTTVKQQSMVSTTQNFQQDSQTSANQDAERKSLAESIKKQDLGLKQESLSHMKNRCENSDVKEDEVSFLLENKAKIDFTNRNEEAAVKEELMHSSTGSGPEKDPELPRKLLQVKFMTLTVSTANITRSEPLQNRNSSGKNFKRFCKKPVPGLCGLPKIIGGSDLVAHNRSKNSELEEWLRDAAEQEKQQKLEETLGEELFRYNPKTKRTTKRK